MRDNLWNISSNHPTVAKIDLAAFRENIRTFKSHLNKGMLLAVVKTNAYGHGILPISHAAIESGADRLGVTTVEEGILLRKGGIKIPIQLLSSIFPEQATDVVTYGLTASVSSERLVTALSKAAIKQNKEVCVHLKIDTGLHRFGIDPQEAVKFCEMYYTLPGLKWEGVYTHFSSADEGDWQTTEKQFSLFMETVAELREKGFSFRVHHVGGSTIAIERPDMYLDMVRVGIALFGYTPARRQKRLIALKPVMKLTTKVLQVRQLPANTSVGYGGGYVTTTNEKLAILPIGHGDGYKRALSNKGEVLVGGKCAKIVGTISLDQMVVDVTNIDAIKEADEVVLIGRMETEEITARDVADWADTIVDEVLASMMERVVRKYV